MATKVIETRIREHYVSESGEWLVEKGKVKEARMLKEACEAVERLRRHNKDLHNKVSQMMAEAADKSIEMNMRKRDLEEREKDIQNKEARCRERIESAIKGLNFVLESL